ncbi:phage portal protein [Agarilytica rhodophyticola]|uniref:phage portal protein n=1 Tax=Agarilytica rhodophyticola TaxID=1737490 RepID=UPI000B3489B7|nr:phage portal protein [Agarilytica rhodophyticola]
MKTLNIIDRALMYFAPAAAERRVRAKLRTEHMIARSGYEAANNGRRGFGAAGSSQNAENRRSLKSLRNSSRNLERNNPYLTVALDVIESYAVGTGIKPKAKHPTDKAKEKLAQELMDEWSQSVDCDYRGQTDLFGLQSLSMRTIPLSGESIFIRRHAEHGSMRVPLKLELLEGDYIDDMRDRHTLVGESDLVQGVRIRNGRPYEYFLHDNHPGEAGSISGDSKPVHSSLVAHGFSILRPGQVRGIPWGYSAFTRMKGLDDFKDARIEQQRIAACLMASVWTEDGADEKGDPLPDTMEPGLILKLSGSERMETTTPPSVSGQDTFVKGEERVIASAYGITYEELTGDYSSANFANGKMARLKMFANVERWQRNILITQQLKKISEWFIDAAYWSGLDIRGVKFEWTKPRKDVLDIKNELPAIVQTVRSGLNSLQGELRARGYDVEQVFNEIKEDAELADRLGIVLDTDPRLTNKSGQIQSKTVNDTGDAASSDLDGNDNLGGELNASNF